MTPVQTVPTIAGWAVDVPWDWHVLPTTPPPAGAPREAEALWRVAAGLVRPGVLFTVFGPVEPAPLVRFGGAITVAVTPAEALPHAGADTVTVVLDGLGPAARIEHAARAGDGTRVVNVDYLTGLIDQAGARAAVSCALISRDDTIDPAEWSWCADRLADTMTPPAGFTPEN